MNFNFDFSFAKNGTPIVTLSSTGIAFNLGSRLILGKPESIDIGYDSERNVIGVRPHREGSDTPDYKFEPRVKDEWVRISMKDFVKYLAQRSGIDFLTKAQQFIPERDAESGILLIHVDVDHLKNSGTVQE
jgi:hypothetical protein